MTNAHHDAAVQLLTDHQRFVRLVVQREIKGPLEPPQSPRSPLLKGLSPSGYMANRPGYKRSVGGDSPIEDLNQKYITNTSPVVVPPVNKNNNAVPKTNGTETGAAQPVPAPRRLTSQSSISGLNGSTQNGTSTGSKSEDDEAQVSEIFLIYIKFKKSFCINHIKYFWNFIDII